MDSQSDVKGFLLEAIPSHPRDVARVAAAHFGLSRQAVNRHLRELTDRGLVIAQGATRSRTYELARVRHTTTFNLAGEVQEDAVWRRWAEPLLSDLRGNVLNICHHAFTEIVNNALDHSEGDLLSLAVERTPLSVEMRVVDDGVGIFSKIRKELGLEDERHAVLELSKGKVTTDPARHSGEGIFFTSRMLDVFSIRSGNLFLVHEPSSDETSDWLVERADRIEGTNVWMEVDTRTLRTAGEIFDRYTSGEQGDFSFSITHVPVALARYGSENLISRSQAKRLVARFDRFRKVVLNFSDVDEIGQAFADEIFRVFQTEHPDVVLVPANASEQVQQMISRAIGTRHTGDASEGSDQLRLFTSDNGDRG